MKNLRTGTAKFDTIKAKDANGLSIQDDGGNGLFIKDGGNVGIGTSSPDHILCIEGAEPTFRIFDADNILNQEQTIAFGTEPGNRTHAEIAAINTNIGNDSGSLSFKTNGGASLTERMRITSDGNVGIGTTNPGSKLHISGGDSDLRDITLQYEGTSAFAEQGIVWKDFRGQTNAQITNILHGDGNGAPAANLDFRIGDGTSSLRHAMTIKANGNVGIGTTNPNVNLDVNGGADNTVVFGGRCDSDISHEEKFGYGTNIRFALVAFSEAYADDPAYAYGGGIKIQTRDSRTNVISDRLTINNQGNVGIGTANPGTDRFKIVATHSGAGKVMHAGSSNGEANGFVLQGNGNVGIGTSNPAQDLHVFTNTDKYGIYVGDADQSHLAIAGTADGANGYSLIQSFGGDPRVGNVLILNRDGGNVGIGISDPGTYKLYINGTARVSGGDVTSDDRVKHNEQNIVGAIETLGKLAPKKYIKTTEMYEANHDFELDADGNPVDADGEPVEHSIEAGVIAQQVLEVPELAFMVSPEGVDEDGNVTSPHGLNYNSLFTYAIAAIQEQQQIIEDLKSQNASLESRISALES